MRELQKAAALFEVNVPDFKQLKACRREIGLLKGLWDMITMVRSSFEDWNTTLWKDINVENMEMDCKKFVKVHCHIRCTTHRPSSQGWASWCLLGLFFYAIFNF